MGLHVNGHVSGHVQGSSQVGLHVMHVYGHVGSCVRHVGWHEVSSHVCPPNVSGGHIGTQVILHVF